MNTDLPVMLPSITEIFWETHRSKIIIGTVLFFLLLTIAGTTLLISRSRHLAASTLFTEARDVEGWQQVVARYPHSEAAANALLLIAASQRADHDLEKSSATYALFLKKFPHHPLAISALIGKAINEECTIHNEQALDAFQQAVLVYPKSYGAPFALLSRARLLSVLGKTDEAKRSLQLIATQYPNSVAAIVISRQGLAH